jgi:hypothetical protein
VSAEQEIADLDAALLADGENVVLRRVKGTSGLASQQNVDVTCRAFVRGYDPNELVNGITQQDRRVVISSTEIDAADWPADEADSTSGVDQRVPRKNRGDKCIIGGYPCSVEAAAPIYLDGTLVRIDMRVRGLA